MEYRLKRNGRAGRRLRRVARGEWDRARAAAENRELGLEARIHQVRSGLNRARAAVRLVMTSADGRARQDVELMTALRRDLTAARDATVAPLTIRRLAARAKGRDDPALLGALANLERHATDQAQAGDGSAALVAVGRALRTRRARLGRWRVHHDHRALRQGLRESYRRARRAFFALDRRATAEGFHEWRKANKRLGYQLRLLADIAPELTAELGQPCETIGDLLGEAHDLVVLRERLATGTTRFAGAGVRQRLHELIEREILRLHRIAQIHGAPALRAKPSAIVRRLRDEQARRRHGPGRPRTTTDDVAPALVH